MAEAVCVLCCVQCPVDSVVEMDKDREYPFQEYKVRHTSTASPHHPVVLRSFLLARSRCDASGCADWSLTLVCSLCGLCCLGGG
jgi:hypothetical protein